MTLFAELKRRNVLRVAAAYVAVSWLLIQVVETLFPVFGLSDAAIRTVVILLAIGFIPAVISAWAFELTPEGLVRDAEVDRAAPSIKASTKRLDRIVMVALALAVGFFAFDKFILDPARDAALAEAAREAELARLKIENRHLAENLGNVEAQVGALAGSVDELAEQERKRAKEAKIEYVVFDRGGYQFHGKVKALADAAREAGLWPSPPCPQPPSAASLSTGLADGGMRVTGRQRG